jgi:hypothetical protein
MQMGVVPMREYLLVELDQVALASLLDLAQEAGYIDVAALIAAIAQGHLTIKQPEFADLARAAALERARAAAAEFLQICEALD